MSLDCITHPVGLTLTKSALLKTVNIIRDIIVCEGHIGPVGERFLGGSRVDPIIAIEVKFGLVDISCALVDIKCRDI